MEKTSKANGVAGKRVVVFLLVTNGVGFLLSAYAHHVTVAKTTEAGYEALCDLSPSMSCSRVLTSKYSKGFGLVEHVAGESSILNQTNSTLGMIFYSLFFLLSFSNYKLICKLHLILAVLSIISSIYLACILVILQDFCVVCASTYVVNALNFVFIYKKIKLLSCTTRKTKKRE